MVFDSGIGGLTVFNEIKQLLPNHDYCYLFDNQRLPYGELTEDELIRGCVNLIVTIAQQKNAIIVVVACNSASTLVLPQLRKRLTIPVVGVVPAIKPAAKFSQKKHIGLLATPGTISRDYTSELIQAHADDCKVELFGSSSLVYLAEEKAAGNPIDLVKLKDNITPIVQSEIDTLVLGCTHFPFITEELSALLGKEIKLIDSGMAIATRVQYVLQKKGLADKRKQPLPKLEAVYTKKSISVGINETLTKYGFIKITTLYPNEFR